ncbi:MAG TPA: alcohol dehydrogenase [Deltaproteobacteria bacterium]|nr:alcohol dehydrogenase [Deltaproteobacteria bacterium]
MKAVQFSVSIPQWLALKTLGHLNRKLFYEGPLATVKLLDIPEPRLPSDEWVRIRTRACGMCGSDVNLIFLKDSPSASPFTSFPCVLGHELTGEIVEAGQKVDGLESGDLVTIAPHLNCAARGIDPVCPACSAGHIGSCENFARGAIAPGMFTGICTDTSAGFAEYLVAHKSQVFRLPEGITPESGAVIEPLAVALQAVLDNRPVAGEHVLIIGGGVIGSLVVQAIRALGIECTITVSEPSMFHAALCRKFGADHVFCDGDILSRAEELTGAHRYKPMIGPDILMGGFGKIFDTVGSRQTLNASLRSLATGGVLSVVGIGHDITLDLTPLWLKLQTIKGVFSYGVTEIDGRRQHIFDLAIDLVHKGTVSLSEMVTHTFDLEQFPEMIETNLAKEKNQAVKTVVTFTPGAAP